MTEESSSAGGQAPTSGQPQAGTSPTPQAGSGQQRTYQSVDDALREIQRLQAEIATTNNEAAKHRVEKNTALAELKKFQDAQLSETEKLQKQAETLQAQIKSSQERVASSEVRLLAKSLGFRNPALAYGAIASQLKLEDDGTPKNAEELLQALIKSDPYLVEIPSQQQPAPGQRPSIGASNPSRSATSGQQPLTHELIAQMGEAEYLARRAEIMEFKRKNPIRF